MPSVLIFLLYAHAKSEVSLKLTGIWRVIYPQRNRVMNLVLAGQYSDFPPLFLMCKNLKLPGCVSLRRFKALSGDGFTLVEIVLAIGITAFALTAIFGLVGLATQGTRGADIDARLATINRRIVSTYQSQPFSTLVTGAAVVSGTSYYDYQGTPMTSGIAVTSGTYFRCVVKDSGPILSGTYGRLLQIQISWPYPKFTGTDVSVTSILNYR